MAMTLSEEFKDFVRQAERESKELPESPERVCYWEGRRDAWRSAAELVKPLEAELDEQHPPLDEEEAKAILNAAEGACMAGMDWARAQEVALAELKKRQAARGQFSVGDRVTLRATGTAFKVKCLQFVQVEADDKTLHYFRPERLIPAEAVPPKFEVGQKVFVKSVQRHARVDELRPTNRFGDIGIRFDDDTDGVLCWMFASDLKSIPAEPEPPTCEKAFSVGDRVRLQHPGRVAVEGIFDGYELMARVRMGTEGCATSLWFRPEDIELSPAEPEPLVCSLTCGACVYDDALQDWDCMMADGDHVHLRAGQHCTECGVELVAPDTTT